MLSSVFEDQLCVDKDRTGFIRCGVRARTVRAPRLLGAVCVFFMSTTISTCLQFGFAVFGEMSKTLAPETPHRFRDKDANREPHPVHIQMCRARWSVECKDPGSRLHQITFFTFLYQELFSLNNTVDVIHQLPGSRAFKPAVFDHTL